MPAGTGVRARLGVLLLAGLASGLGAAWLPDLRAAQGPSGRPVRVLLASVPVEAPMPTTGPWRLLDPSRRVIASGNAGERWSVQREGLRVRAIRGDAPASGWSSEPLTFELADESGQVTWDRKAYRGSIVFAPTDSALRVINRLEVEEYLRGVLPLEIGAQRTSDHAAVEAQAVAARSFTYVRMVSANSRAWDLTATDNDQVYGGVAVETFWGDLAIAATAGWVLSERGRVVTAPYHAACGGSTALPSEVWRGGQDGFLRTVSDTAPTGRPWCDAAPRVSWERRLSASELANVLTRNAPAYATIPAGAATSIRDLRIEGRTASGRVRGVTFVTSSGDVTLRGNDIRFVLRGATGDILPSTWFSLTVERDPGGRLAGVALQGRGNGHGIGLCQWGAIARARAGADFRAILKAYYPGAELTRAP